MASQHEMREQRSTATEAKKTAAKEAIITSKETRTKAETTNGQAIAMRPKKKRQKCEYKKGKNDRKKVETSENATAKVMSN